MRANEMINKIKTVLEISTPEKKEVQVKLESMKLENGTEVEAESFEEGNEIFILTDDEKVAMPVGEYILEDSRLLVVEQEGLIADVREVSDDVPEKEDTTSDLEDKEKTTDEKKMADVGDWEGLDKRIQNLEDAIADLKRDKVEAGGKEEEYSKENAKLKEELSKPAAQAIKHSPEAVGTKNEKVTFQKHRTKTVMDSVLSKLINN